MISLLRIIYALLVFSIPFNGIIPILPAGELSGDAFFYTSILFNGSLFLSVVILIKRNFPSAALLPMWRQLIVPILIFFFVTMIHIQDVIGNSTGSRDGFSKFLLSFGVVIYYALTFSSIAIYSVILGANRFLQITSSTFLACGTFMASIAALEAIGWFISPARSVLVAFRSLFSVNPDAAMFRISGVSYEPSFYAFSMLTALPWIVFHARQRRSSGAWFIALCLIVACTMSGARTALVGLLGYFILAMLASTRKPIVALTAAGAAFASMIIGLMMPLYMSSVITSFDDVSSVTRVFLSSRAVQVGFDHLFGVGFGQVQFYLGDMLDSSIYQSWELKAWFYGDRAGQLAPLYSWYARTCGEIGIIAYGLLTILVSSFVYKLFRDGWWLQAGSLGKELFKLTASFLGIFFATSLSSDSYKFLPIWFVFLCYGILQTIRNDEAAIAK